MATDKISDFEFIRMDRMPELVQAKLAAHTRPGTDGVTLHDVGTWAEPFETRTLAAASDLDAALNLYVNYRSLIGGPAVTVTWASRPFALVNHRFYVLQLRQPDCRRLIRGVGPSGDYFAECEVTWVLQPIFVG